MNLSSRTKFLLLMGVFVVPVIAAYVAYFGWRPSAHNNYGTLLPATPLAMTQGRLIDGVPLDLSALQGRWIMVHVGPAACGPDCLETLYLMRQTRITQGKDQGRIERLWVVTDAGSPDPAVQSDHPGLNIWRPESPGFSAQFPAGGDRTRHIYLIDPLGNLMMRFPEKPDPKGIMKDLKLLLKASQVG